MSNQWLSVHGPQQAQHPVVLDSPHSGTRYPDDFGAIADERALRDGEDCYVDELWLAATQRGIPLLAAQFPRTYIDPNRHPGDIDLALMQDGHWPDEHQPSGQHQIGKALIWRTLDNGDVIYDRKLTVDEVRQRIARYHQPYHQTLQRLLDDTHARFGAVYHINCHSMDAVTGAMSTGVPGTPRPDMVLGDIDGTTSEPGFTEFVRQTLANMGYWVTVNDPFKGLALVEAYAAPHAGRHSLQLEVNKGLYMNPQTLERHDGFARVQADFARLVDALIARYSPTA
jgi:N-formylglutamate amidohydrolase